MIGGEGAIMQGVRLYYNDIAERSADDPDAPDLPSFDALDAETVTAWMLAYAAVLQVSVHTATALRLTLPEEV